MAVEQVDTPALLLDLDAFESNLDRLVQSLRGTSVRVRPHAKSHKCAEIALRQIARGAVGVCCQKVSEAEALVHGGVGDVLIANEVVGTQKLARLALLARQARTSVCVDDAGNVQDLSQRPGRQEQRWICVGGNVGAISAVRAWRTSVALARPSHKPGLRFGIHAYHGAAQRLRTPGQRRRASHRQ
jgi:D-serine deaminase-like pyridoxal phosphate-dependent protein